MTFLGYQGMTLTWHQSLLEPGAPHSCPQVNRVARALNFQSRTLYQVASFLQFTPQCLHLLLVVPASQPFLVLNVSPATAASPTIG